MISHFTTVWFILIKSTNNKLEIVLFYHVQYCLDNKFLTDLHQIPSCDVKIMSFDSQYLVKT